MHKEHRGVFAPKNDNKTAIVIIEQKSVIFDFCITNQACLW
jgi:hypothetical protein